MQFTLVLVLVDVGEGDNVLVEKASMFAIFSIFKKGLKLDFF